MGQAISLPFGGSDCKKGGGTEAGNISRGLKVITGGKALAEKSEVVEDWVQSKVHEIIEFRREEVLFDIIRYASDKELENYIKSYVGREGFNKTSKMIGDTASYLLWKWWMEYESIWRTYKGDMGHFMGNYFGWYPFSYLWREDYINLVMILRFMDALYRCEDMHTIFKNSRSRCKKDKLDGALWAEAQMIRLWLK